MKRGVIKPVLLAALTALATDALALDQAMLRFVDAKEAQAREFAKGQPDRVPSIVWSFFDAVRVDDWETVTNLDDRLQRMSGRNYGSDEPEAPALRTMLWQPIKETLGAYEQFHDWNNKWLHRYAKDIMDSIPPGSIYFGGTDPGRFLISALSDSHRDGRPFFTLTQNQLADQTYLDYLRAMFAGKIYTPTFSDLTNVFQQYTVDAQERLKAGKLKPGENVQVRGGKVQVSGQVAVMEINARLVRIIFDKNAGREFYIEQSFPLDWIYPYLSPRGMIFAVQSKPIASLPPDTVQKDAEYWKRLSGDLIGDWLADKTSVKDVCDFADRIFLRKDKTGFKGDSAFIENEDLRKCYSKLRSDIAALYIWRADHTNDNDEKTRMNQAADLALRQAIALCPVSPEAVFRYVQLLESLRRHDDALRIADTALRLDPEAASIQQLVRSLRRNE